MQERLDSKLRVIDTRLLSTSFNIDSDQHIGNRYLSN